MGNSSPGPSRTRCRKGGWGGRDRALALPVPQGQGGEGDFIPLLPPLPLMLNMVMAPPGLVPGWFSTILQSNVGVPALPL